MIITANPGGPGQAWLRSRYRLHPFPKRSQVYQRQLPNGNTHHIAVIPSRLTDNKILLARDPAYADRLHLVGGAALVRAWLDGDWSAIEGAFFELWDETRHVIDPFIIPPHWLRFRSMDWGFARPFSVGWWAVASEPTHALAGNDTPVMIPRGALVRYREWYGSIGEPNVGLRLEAELIATGIRQREVIERDAQGREVYELVSYGVLDPAAFAQSGQAYGYKGPTIAERMAMAGAIFRPADNSRIAKLGALGGWDQVRARLRGDIEGNPMLVVFSICTDLIRTLPVMQHDKDNPEDMDTDGEDHGVDDTRYACLSRPWARPSPPKKKERTPAPAITLNELVRATEQRRRNSYLERI
jgi:hypothetical protein